MNKLDNPTINAILPAVVEGTEIATGKRKWYPYLEYKKAKAYRDSRKSSPGYQSRLIKRNKARPKHQYAKRGTGKES